jgi:hypothetical protein
LTSGTTTSERVPMLAQTAAGPSPAERGSVRQSSTRSVRPARSSSMIARPNPSSRPRLPGEARHVAAGRPVALDGDHLAGRVDLAVARARGADVPAERLGRRRLDLLRVGEPAQPVAQREQERLPPLRLPERLLGAHAGGGVGDQRVEP